MIVRAALRSGEVGSGTLGCSARGDFIRNRLLEKQDLNRALILLFDLRRHRISRLFSFVSSVISVMLNWLSYFYYTIKYATIA